MMRVKFTLAFQRIAYVEPPSDQQAIATDDNTQQLVQGPSRRWTTSRIHTPSQKPGAHFPPQKDGVIPSPPTPGSPVQRTPKAEGNHAPADGSPRCGAAHSSIASLRAAPLTRKARQDGASLGKGPRPP